MSGINYEHVDSLLKSGGYGRYFLSVDGVHLVSDGRVLLVYPGTIPQGFRELPAIEKMWRSATASLPSAKFVEPEGGLVVNDKGLYYRKVGIRSFDERFLRCFPGARFATCSAGGSEGGSPSSIIAVVDGQVVALIQGTRNDSYAGTPVTGVPTDAEIFFESACEGNGYYLAGDKKIRQEIGLVEEELAELRERMRELSDEERGLEETIESLEARLSTTEVAR